MSQLGSNFVYTASKLGIDTMTVSHDESIEEIAHFGGMFAPALTT